MRDRELVLRRPASADVEPLAALLAEPEVKRWWPDDDYDVDNGWVIEVDGACAGWVQYEEETYEWYPGVALDIAITTTLHGRGYGRRALRLAIEHFVAKGHHRFTIDPHAHNERAIRSYTAVGFRPVGILRSYGRNVDGSWHDGLLMDLVVLDGRFGDEIAASRERRSTRKGSDDGPLRLPRGAPVGLAGERVVLRPARPEDADALAAGFAEDPNMGAMLGIDPEHQNADWLRGTFREGGEGGDEPKAYWFIIADPRTGEPIGEIGLVEISWPDRRAGLSVLVLPGSRRTGVGREAIELLVGWAQGELDLHRVELHTLPENVPMQRLAEVSGFTREGVLRDYSDECGRLVDNVVYARLPG